VLDYNAGNFERSVLPVMEAGLAELVDDRHRISPSVAIEPAYGHTAGHSVLHLVSQANEAVFAGDAFHHPLQIVDPALHLMGCDDLGDAIATRRRLIALCAERSALVIPAHFPEPHAGWIRLRNGAAAFEALT
jgi:glyoxylase-like metal-dependent hydrolase (beta-lactamase superfamily II)